ncbi:MAG: bifunctional glutamate N-acetyltransferase/amino-acid acetyltransferase ArgJ [Candidatus Omnitrophota bacterium]
MEIIKGSVTAPNGFTASGINCGLKKDKLDLALIFSEVPALAAGIFTKNALRAAPVIISRKYLNRGKAQAIIANSGNANCLTGKQGFKDAEKIVETVSSFLSVKKGGVLIASTGIIGKPLPADKIIGAIPKLVKELGKIGEIAAAKAIMTTDLYPKKIAVSVNISGKTVKIGGIAKGSGMICPDMATMLCFLTTDADIELKALKTCLMESAGNSFNSITVDGDMSTNDTVFILANSLAGNPKIKQGTPDYKKFRDCLNYVSVYLAKEIAKDGEGASKFIEVEVKKAASETEAKKIAAKIANSNLVKTAMAGEDPNVGRIASAAGAASLKLDESKLDIYLNGIKIVCGGNVDYQKMSLTKKALKKKDINITVDLNSGGSSAKVWTCDLTEGYIKINARYN